MSRIVEVFLESLASAMNFFEGLRARRSDDPLVAEHKAKQRACLWSPAPLLLVLIFGWAAGTLLGALEGVSGSQVSLTAARDWVALGFVVAGALSSAYVLYTVVSLYHFSRKHSIR